jgi:uncharacterized protein
MRTDSDHIGSRPITSSYVSERKFGSGQRRYTYLMGTLRVHIIPNAKIDTVVGEYGDAIKIKLRAPAVEGRANTALRRFLAEKLSIPRRAIVREHGEKSRDKVIRIDGLSEGDIRRGLLDLSGNSSRTIR